MSPVLLVLVCVHMYIKFPIFLFPVGSYTYHHSQNTE